MDEPLMTVDEMATFLKVNPKTVYRLLKRGEIPAYRIANQWRFDKAIINAWLAQQRVGNDKDVA